MASQTSASVLLGKARGTLVTGSKAANTDRRAQRQQEATLRSGPRTRLNFRARIPTCARRHRQPAPMLPAQPSPEDQDSQALHDTRRATEWQRPAPAATRSPTPNSPGSATAPASRLIWPNSGNTSEPARWKSPDFAESLLCYDAASPAFRCDGLDESGCDELARDARRSALAARARVPQRGQCCGTLTESEGGFRAICLHLCSLTTHSIPA